MNTAATTLTRPPPGAAPRNGSRAPVDLFADPPARERRYLDVLNRLSRLERDMGELRETVQDWAVIVDTFRARVRGFEGRIEHLEAAAERPCVCHRELEDLKITADELGGFIDKINTELDRVCTDAHIPVPVLDGDDPLPAPEVRP